MRRSSVSELSRSPACLFEKLISTYRGGSSTVCSRATADVTRNMFGSAESVDSGELRQAFSLQDALSTVQEAPHIERKV